MRFLEYIVVGVADLWKKGMNIRWDHFVNQYDTTRYSGPDGRDTRHIQFVREFASVVSVLQVSFFLFFFFYWSKTEDPSFLCI